MKKNMLRCYRKMLLHSESIVELFTDLATSEGNLWIVAISLFKFYCMTWIKERISKICS